LSVEKYAELVTDNWSFKDETIRYIESDLVSLYQVITKANKQVFLDYGLNMVDSITISK